MKTLIIWVGALLIGFLGGVFGQKFSDRVEAIEQVSPTRAQSFELIDRWGRVVSTWGTDQWGRPILAMGDQKWEGRIVIGPLFPSDVVDERNPTDTWGVTIEAPADAARATLATSTRLDTKQPVSFIALQTGEQHWERNAAGER